MNEIFKYKKASKHLKLKEKLIYFHNLLIYSFHVFMFTYRNHTLKLVNSISVKFLMHLCVTSI